MSLFDMRPLGIDAYGHKIMDAEPQPVAKPIAPLNPTVDPNDDLRLSDQQQFILDTLRGGPQSNVDLSRIGLRFGARLKELRDAGYTITKENHGQGLWVYTLESEPNASGAGR